MSFADCNKFALRRTNTTSDSVTFWISSGDMSSNIYDVGNIITRMTEEERDSFQPSFYIDLYTRESVDPLVTFTIFKVQRENKLSIQYEQAVIEFNEEKFLISIGEWIYEIKTPEKFLYMFTIAQKDKVGKRYF